MKLFESKQVYKSQKAKSSEIVWACMDDSRMPCQATQWEPEAWHKEGRPCKNWLEWYDTT